VIRVTSFDTIGNMQAADIFTSTNLPLPQTPPKTADIATSVTTNTTTATKLSGTTGYVLERPVLVSISQFGAKLLLPNVVYSGSATSRVLYCQVFLRGLNQTIPSLVSNGPIGKRVVGMYGYGVEVPPSNQMTTEDAIALGVASVYRHELVFNGSADSLDLRGLYANRPYVLTVVVVSELLEQGGLGTGFVQTQPPIRIIFISETDSVTEPPHAGRIIAETDLHSIALTFPRINPMRRIVRRYEVRIDDGDGGPLTLAMNFTQSHTHHDLQSSLRTIDGLNPATPYRMQVVCFDQEGKELSTVATITTDKPPLASGDVTSMGTGERSIHLSLPMTTRTRTTPPSLVSVVRHVVRIAPLMDLSPKASKLDASAALPGMFALIGDSLEHRVDISNLLPYSWYRIRVESILKGGSIVEKVLDIRTQPPSFVYIPSVKVLFKTARWFVLDLPAPSEPALPKRQYKVELSSPSLGDYATVYQGPSKPLNVSFLPATPSSSASGTSSTRMPLMPDTLYGVRITI